MLKQASENIMSWEPLSAEESAAFVAARLNYLIETDQQIRDALPLTEVSEAKAAAGLGLAQIVATCMTAYGDRPALARRAIRLETDPDTGRTERRLQNSFETLSYRQLWSRSKAIASFWLDQGERSLRAGDPLCIIAFGGVEFVTVNLAAIHNGAVVVPLQTNAQREQLLGMVKEVEPKWLATSIEALDISVDAVLNGHGADGILLFDYRPEVDSERETYEKAVSQLAASGLAHIIIILEDAIRAGEQAPEAPLYAEPDTHERLCSIYYTSGSTGTPKGVMYPEKHLKTTWLVNFPIPMFYMHYMPMNHGFGTMGVFMTLSLGGTVYFTGKSDLSTIFEDIGLARPTFIGLVPRICEMIFQRYKIEFDRRAPAVADRKSLRDELLVETRDGLLGGRFLAANFGSAPLAPDLRAFMEHCLGFKWDDIYGATEMQAVTRNGEVLRPAVTDYKLDDVPELGYFKTDKPYPRGELLIKSDGLMLGYYKQPEATAAAFDSEGYYRSGDVVGEVAPDRLIYLDRRNNVQKLSQGEFVAIAALEALYTNGHPLIRQAYLYGTSDRSFLVGVFVPNEEAMAEMGIPAKESEVKAALRNAIQAVAEREKLKAHEVPRDFLVEFEPFTTENGLLAGIGKYRRPMFKHVYAQRLEALYDSIEADQEESMAILRRDGRNLPVIEAVARAIRATLGIDTIDLSQRHSFAELGGDSLAALSCSLLLEDIFEVEVPVSVIDNPAGSLQQLARFIERARDASFEVPTFASVHGRRATEIRASDLKLDKFIDDATLRAAETLSPPARQIRTVLLTGANGFLGRFLCMEWLERMAKVGGKVICIIRGENQEAAQKRLVTVFDSGDASLKERFDKLASKHIEILAGDLGEPRLGLDSEEWQRLAKSVDQIVHPAALVNHLLPYSQLFGPNVVGTAELIRLAITSHLKPIDNVSTLGVAVQPDGTFLNEDADVRTVTPIRQLHDDVYASGYIDSKWAGEVLLLDAFDRFALPVSIFRSDMILAHSIYRGQINIPDIFTRWLISTLATRLAPSSFYIKEPGITPHYDGLPVDFLAASVATLGENGRQGYRCYHMANPNDDGISLDTFVDWMTDAGYGITRVEDYGDWLNRTETALRSLPEERRQRSSLPVIDQLRYQIHGSNGSAMHAQRFRADVRKFEVGDGNIPSLSREFLLKNLEDLHHLGLEASQ